MENSKSVTYFNHFEYYVHLAADYLAIDYLAIDYLAIDYLAIRLV